MSIKLLLFPTLIVLSLIIIIGYIQPDVSAIMSKRQELAVQEEALNKVESVEQNIRSFTQQLNTRRESENMVKRYFPETIDEDRAVDTVNFLAQQAGVIVTALSITENPLPPKTETVDPATGSAIDPSAPTDGTQPAAEKLMSYKVGVVVLGSYDSIRNFFDRMHRTDRLQVAGGLKISDPKEELVADKEIPAGLLKGELNADIACFPAKPAGNALHNPLFQTATLDVRVANDLSDFINSPVGDLDPPTAGRNNPFEPVP